MSFSYKVKEELSKHQQNARHCQMAEFATLVLNLGQMTETGAFVFPLENQLLKEKIVYLLKRIFGISPRIEMEGAAGAAGPAKKGNGCIDEKRGGRKGRDSEGCILYIEDSEVIERMLEAVKLSQEDDKRISTLLLKSSCCKRVFLETSYLCIGSMSDPEKSYHLEFVCETEPQGQQLQAILKDFDIEAKITQRKKYYVVYLKESAMIVELLSVIGAHKALMEMENMRILKELRNDVNRRCNCDAANINKALQAAEKQMQDIKYLQQNYGFEKLSRPLQEIALARLEYPAASLKELGEYLDPPVGKSGVNHRLRKLSELAETLRGD